MIFGGAKPVPVDPGNYSNSSAATSSSRWPGSSTNAADRPGVRAAPRRHGRARRGGAGAAASTLGIVQAMLVIGVVLNAVLIAFNLLPIPPLDGSHVFKYLLPAQRRRALRAIRPVRPARARRRCCRGVATSSARWMSPVHRAPRTQVIGCVNARRFSRRPRNGCDDRDRAVSHATRPRSGAAPPSFVVELTEFSGPLDLLLTLIREEQVDIYDIPIARIAEQFLRAHPHAAAQRGGGLSRDGRAAAAHQGADAAAAGRRRGGVGGSARGARAPAARVPADARGRGRAGARAERSGAIGSRARTSRRPPRRREAPLALSLERAARRRGPRAARREAIRRMHDVVPRALDVPGAITVDPRAARHPRARALDRPRSARAPSPGRCSRRCSALLEMAKLGELPRRSSRARSPTWRSRVTPLAKLLEAALFASARPIPTEELAALDPEASQGGARRGARRAARALRRRRPRRRARGARRRLADPHARRVHRGDRARAARRASAAALARPRSRRSRSSPTGSRSGAPRSRRFAASSVGSVLKSLHERGLIDVVGRGEGMGRPLLYGTTPLFLEHFALRHLDELPRADELAVALRAEPRAL